MSGIEIFTFYALVNLLEQREIFISLLLNNVLLREQFFYHLWSKLLRSLERNDYKQSLMILSCFNQEILFVAHASDFLSLKLPNCGLVLYALEGLECQG